MYIYFLPVNNLRSTSDILFLMRETQLESLDVTRILSCRFTCSSLEPCWSHTTRIHALQSLSRRISCLWLPGLLNYQYHVRRPWGQRACVRIFRLQSHRINPLTVFDRFNKRNDYTDSRLIVFYEQWQHKIFIWVLTLTSSENSTSEVQKWKPCIAWISEGENGQLVNYSQASSQ